MPRSKSKFWGRFNDLGGHGSMWEPLEMFTASLMENMLQIRKNNDYFVTKVLFWNFWEKVVWGSRRWELSRWGHTIGRFQHHAIKPKLLELIMWSRVVFRYRRRYSHSNEIVIAFLFAPGEIYKFHNTSDVPWAVEMNLQLTRAAWAKRVWTLHRKCNTIH